MGQQQENHPFIRQVGEATHDIVTPANIVSAAGLVLSLYGATHINEMSGVLQYGAGRVFDLADGFVARRTYPGSRLGAVVDGSFDKIAMAAGLAGAAATESVPLPVVGTIFALNVINAVANVYADRKGAEPVTSWAGKRGMFGQNLVLGSFLLAHSLSGNNALEAAGWASSAVTLPISLKASYEYTKQAVDVRRNTKAHHRQKR